MAKQLFTRLFLQREDPFQGSTLSPTIENYRMVFMSIRKYDDTLSMSDFFTEDGKEKTIEEIQEEVRLLWSRQLQSNKKFIIGSLLLATTAMVLVYWKMNPAIFLQLFKAPAVLRSNPVILEQRSALLWEEDPRDRYGLTLVEPEPEISHEIIESTKTWKDTLIDYVFHQKSRKIITMGTAALAASLLGVSITHYHNEYRIGSQVKRFLIDNGKSISFGIRSNFKKSSAVSTALDAKLSAWQNMNASRPQNMFSITMIELVGLNYHQYRDAMKRILDKTKLSTLIYRILFYQLQENLREKNELLDSVRVEIASVQGGVEETKDSGGSTLLSSITSLLKDSTWVRSTLFPLITFLVTFLMSSSVFKKNYSISFLKEQARAKEVQLLEEIESISLPKILPSSKKGKPQKTPQKKTIPPPHPLCVLTAYGELRTDRTEIEKLIIYFNNITKPFNG